MSHYSLPPSQYGVPVDYETSNQQLIQVQGNASDTTVQSSWLQGQPAHDWQSASGPHGPSELSYSSYTSASSIHGGAATSYEEEDESEYLQPGTSYQDSWSSPISPQSAMSLHMSQTVTDSPLQSPIGTSAGSLSSQAQDWTGANHQGAPPFLSGGNERQQPDNSSGPTTVSIPAVEDNIRSVGSQQTRIASGQRRTREGSYVCPFRNTGCEATFTTSHNLKYHTNAHLGLTPYQCSQCKYAAASPGTLKRHVKAKHEAVAASASHLIDGSHGTLELEA